MERSSATPSRVQRSLREKGWPALAANNCSSAASAPVSFTGLPAAREPRGCGIVTAPRPSALDLPMALSAGAARRSKRINAKQQFARLERLGQIIVRAQFQARQCGRRDRPGRSASGWDSCEFLAHARGQLQAGFPWHHHVQDHRSNAMLFIRARASAAPGAALTRKPLLDR